MTSGPRFAVLVLLALLGAGCAAPLTPGQRAREAAHDYSMAVRFGRMDMALDLVSSANRTSFATQHAAWGNAVRILDCELMTMSMPARERADVLLNVGWQRVDETEMRVTQLAQTWRDHRGTWLLESERRTGGDVGLLGERTVVVGPPRTGNVQYESIRIP